ncbi:unnamed protein product [Soboliphyme baturini]|uniref:Uncharacterized protein n=1 Tax=Soboliphyme baturini TaxID=241478 RepID=A0A183IAT4_9BILA|nr:unnamed protein product [Soboliphyme baturini]
MQDVGGMRQTAKRRRTEPADRLLSVAGIAAQQHLKKIDGTTTKNQVEGTVKINLMQICGWILFQTPTVMCRSSDPCKGSVSLDADLLRCVCLGDSKGEAATEEDHEESPL